MIGKVIDEIKNGMMGRMCDVNDNVRLLLQVVQQAGDGNYLEVGVLHGGSLCAVALLKKRLRQSGLCYGIDPFDGYYMDYLTVKKRGKEIDPVTNLPVSLEIVKENIKRFDLDNVRLIQSRSDPLPFVGDRVAVAYIDGDHWGDAPTRDWCNINPLVSDFVVFDNVDDGHPAVKQAVEFALMDVRWKLHLRQGITCIVRRNV